MDKDRKRELIVGTFTVASLTVFIVMIFAINGMKAIFSEHNSYQVRFHNVGNLKENAAVFYSGYEIGRVTDIGIDYTHDRPVHVKFEIPTDIFICDGDSVFVTTKGLVGSEILAVLPSVPRGEKLVAHTEIYGIEPMTLTSIYGDWEPRLTDVVLQAKNVLQGINQMVSDPALHQQIYTTIDDADKMLLSYQAIADDNRAGIRNTVNNVSVASNDIPTITRDLKQLSSRLDETAVAIQSVANNVDGLTSENRENIAKTLANVTTISENLKAFSAEIEANPWRLLRRPSDRRER